LTFAGAVRRRLTLVEEEGGRGGEVEVGWGRALKIEKWRLEIGE
jgi:hypothetical protein